MELYCDDRCTPHACRPLSEASIRHVHNLLNGAFSRAVRWRWIGVNPITQAQAPTQPTPDPTPPTQTQAACIAMEAWRDPDWGMFVWLAMTTGARRGELCALRWDRIDNASREGANHTKTTDSSTTRSERFPCLATLSIAVLSPALASRITGPPHKVADSPIPRSASADRNQVSPGERILLDSSGS
jgi:integrase